MTDTRVHPITGQVLSRDARPQVVGFGSLSRTIEVPGWYPEGEGDSIHSGADLRAKEETLKELRAAYGLRVRQMRKRLNLTQVEAGRLIGGGPTAFQKYEKGLMAPNPAAVGLLEILALDPGKLEVLRRLRLAEGVPALAKVRKSARAIRQPRSRRDQVAA